MPPLLPRALSSTPRRYFSFTTSSKSAGVPPPVVAVPCCYHPDPHHSFASLHAVADKYVRSVAHSAQVVPIMVPALGGGDFPVGWAKVVLEGVDGVLITGSPSNVHPDFYDPDQPEPVPPFDLNRDNTSIPLIQAAIELDIPFLGICRGLQELNVALGGTLTSTAPSEQIYHGYPTDVIDGEGEGVERFGGDVDQNKKFGPAHSVSLTGTLREIVGEDEIKVNTCHYQTIDRLANGLAIEATAPDGVIEAVRIESATRFGMAVQWHPEYRQWREGKTDESEVELQRFIDRSSRLYDSFGDACRQTRAGKMKKFHD